MSKLEKYEIGLVHLKNKEYLFDFEVDDAFFEAFTNSPIQKGNFKVKLLLNKSETIISMYFTIEGQAQLSCDRSLEEFDYPIQLKEKLILKFGDHHEQLTDELEMIARNALSFNVAQYIYEFISVVIPMKKLHPKFQTQEDNTDEDEILVYSSLSEDTQSDAQEDRETDPRWEILKRLKD